MSTSAHVNSNGQAGKRDKVVIKKKPAKVRIVVSEEQRRAMIAEAAYYIAERRGFASGDEVQDWLVAESQVEIAIAAGKPPRSK